MPRERFHATNIHTLPVVDGERTVYFDTTKPTQTIPPGLALRVTDSSRVFYVVYRLHGRKRWYCVGDTNAKNALSAARANAKNALKRVDEGRDPQLEKQEARKAEQAKKDRAKGSLAELCRGYLKVQSTPDPKTKKAKLRPKTITYYTWLIEKKVAGTPLGRMMATEVTADDVERHLAAVKSKSGGPTANRLHQVLTTVARYAVKKGRLPASFMAAVDRPAVEETRERVLIDPEIACLMAALKDTDPVAAAAVKILLVCGQRATATLEGLRWDALDLGAKVPTWTIAGQYQKGGRLHLVPLPEGIVRVIEALPKTSERVLPLDLVNYNRTWWGPIMRRTLAIAEENEVPMATFTRHDLRRSAMTGMRALGVSQHVADLVLGHVVGTRMTRIYDRYDAFPERASALAAWCAHVEKVASGEKKRADVLPYEQRA